MASDCARACWENMSYIAHALLVNVVACLCGALILKSSVVLKDPPFPLS
jgi:hypothetical protein